MTPPTPDTTPVHAGGRTEQHTPTHTGEHDEHDDFGGLHRDLPHVLHRRQVLRWMGGLSLAGVLAACSSSDGSSSASSGSAGTSDGAETSGESTTAAVTTTTAVAATTETAGGADVAAAGAEIPDETAGPYPADGSNGPNVLGEDGIVRADLTTSIGSLSGTADGIPTTIQLTVVDAATGAALPGTAVYLWHCTAEGAYSIYEIADQNYLRGVQEADAGGNVTFRTILPGCYAGRWPHCHFEVYDRLGDATAGSSATKTSQLAVPQATCEAAYRDSRYGNSLDNLGRLSLSTDNVFRDGWDDQLATVTGSPDDGYTLTLLVRV